MSETSMELCTNAEVCMRWIKIAEMKEVTESLMEELKDGKKSTVTKFTVARTIICHSDKLVSYFNNKYNLSLKVCPRRDQSLVEEIKNKTSLPAVLAESKDYGAMLEAIHNEVCGKNIHRK